MNMNDDIRTSYPLAVIVASGGLDSCVTAAIARDRYRLAMLHVMYGQRTESRELQAFQDVADALGAEMRMVIRMDHFHQMGGSSLTDHEMAVPISGLDETRIPSTYVPFRNANLLAAAVSWAEVIHAKAVFLGINAMDSSGYPDCRPEFLAAFNHLVIKGTKPETDITIQAPLLNLGKADIVAKGIELNAPLHKTWSCYTKVDSACGRCDSCLLRLKGFRENGRMDPIPYETLD